MVIITDDDIATLPKSASREIEVLEFVPASELDPMMYDRSYFLEPDGKSTKSYVLLAKMLAENRPGGDRAFRAPQQDPVAALAVKDFSKREIMVIHTLLWPDEIRGPRLPGAGQEGRGQTRRAGRWPGKWSSRWPTISIPTATTTTYQAQLQELVQAKLERRRSVYHEEQPKELDETEDVSDLLAKLEAASRRAPGR